MDKKKYPQGITIHELVDLAVQFSNEMQSLKADLQQVLQKRSERLAAEWIESREVMAILKISKRTLQNLRDNGLLPYSRVNGKFYYKSSDLVALLETNYINKKTIGK
jgi:hypothetical protein